MTPPSLETPLDRPPTAQADSNVVATSTIPQSRPQFPKRRGMNTWVRRFGWTLVFGSTAIASAILGAVLASSMPLPGWLGKQAPAPLNLAELWQSGFRYQVTRPVNILVMGVDLPDATEAESDDLFAGRADTILLTRVNPETGDVNVLSIPRDTQVDIPSEGVAKINHANVVGGAEQVAQTIQTNIGPVPIDRYVRVSTGALRELVDLLGGVEVRVPQRMVYEDETQDLYIDLQPGWQTLDGNQAEQFVRFRSDGNGDIGRVQRQQILLKAIRQRLAHPTVIPRLPQVMRTMLRYVDTNLTVEEILALINAALELESDNLHMVMLPGRFSQPEEYIASYWLLEPTASQQVMNQFFDLDAVALLANAEDRAVTSLPIAVQNASGQPRVAREVATYLRQEGFRNVYIVPDWFGELQETQVIAQRGDLNSADIVRSILEVGRVMSDSTGDLESELTIRVGRDWTLLVE